jgi:aspartate aminotransferase-like enzyme
MIGHRGGAMVELIERIDPHLPLAFGLEPASESVCGVHTCSATGMMEAALIGTGPRVLALIHGAFSKRWFEIAQLLGKDARALECAWGETPDPSEIERVLAQEGPFDAVTLVGNETSTGVRAPLKGIAEVLAAHPQTHLLVDVVSLLAGAAIDFDAHALDFALAGTQKALALPPGLTVFCVSKPYLERARQRQERGYYLDPVRILDGHTARKTPSTPCLSLYFALARQLEDISSGATLIGGADPDGPAAWQMRFEKHQRMQARTVQWAAGHGLELFPPADLASPTISCIRAGSIDTPGFIAGLKARGFEIGNGYGKLKNETFRIGHMGDHTEAGLERLLAAADEVLAA